MSLFDSIRLHTPERVRPFLFLSHETTSSLPPSSSPYWSRYYLAGRQDAHLLIGWGVLLVLLRLIVMAIFKHFALWWLTRASRSKPNLKKSSGANGRPKISANGTTSALYTNENAMHSRTSPSSSMASITFSTPMKAEQLSRQTGRVATRFAEQGFAFVYYVFAWLFGLWVNTSMYEERFMDLEAYWIRYPHIPLPSPVKSYYLLALAFYTTQIFILNIEAPRRDHHQMLGHHIVTVILLAVSWFTNISRFGCAILVLLDWCDIFLPLAKMSKYLNIPVLPDIIFVVFLVSWFITRQVLLLQIIWDVTFECPRILPLVWDPAQGLYFSRGLWTVITIGLWALYVLLCSWFWLGCKVAYNVVRGQAVQDVRSDDEDDEAPPATSSSRISSKER